MLWVICGSKNQVCIFLIAFMVCTALGEFYILSYYHSNGWYCDCILTVSSLSIRLRSHMLTCIHSISSLSITIVRSVYSLSAQQLYILSPLIHDTPHVLDYVWIQRGNILGYIRDLQRRCCLLFAQLLLDNLSLWSVAADIPGIFTR